MAARDSLSQSGSLKRREEDQSAPVGVCGCACVELALGTFQGPFTPIQGFLLMHIIIIRTGKKCGFSSSTQTDVVPLPACGGTLLPGTV